MTTTPDRAQLDQYLEAIGAGIDPELARTEIWPPAPVKAVNAAKVILSEPEPGLVVGWDTCGACHTHISRCACPSGPTEPLYVTRWRPVPAKAAAKPVAAPVGVVDQAITTDDVRTTADAPRDATVDLDDPDMTEADRVAIRMRQAASKVQK